MNWICTVMGNLVLASYVWEPTRVQKHVADRWGGKGMRRGNNSTQQRSRVSLSEVEPSGAMLPLLAPTHGLSVSQEEGCVGAWLSCSDIPSVLCPPEAEERPNQRCFTRFSQEMLTCGSVCTTLAKEAP